MKYRLTERIGSGGMAEVFRATGEGPEGFERAFVVKRIHPHLSHTPEFVRMFVDEA
jgi:serine/threonine protein kinase